jgi:3,4-dihydroxy 2-butanone 4-phosphate synthase
VDDEDRENEGDLIYAASVPHRGPDGPAHPGVQTAIVFSRPPRGEDPRAGPSPHGGEEHQPLSERPSRLHRERARRQPRVSPPPTGPDRQAAVAEGAPPEEDLRRPGTSSSLCARPGGVLERAGTHGGHGGSHAPRGRPPYGVLCELTNPRRHQWPACPRSCASARSTDFPGDRGGSRRLREESPGGTSRSDVFVTCRGRSGQVSTRSGPEVAIFAPPRTLRRCVAWTCPLPDAGSSLVNPAPRTVDFKQRTATETSFPSNALSAEHRNIRPRTCRGRFFAALRALCATSKKRPNSSPKVLSSGPMRRTHSFL